MQQSELPVLEHRYNDNFFRRRSRYSPRVSYVVRAIKEMFKSETVVDVGCAVGHVVRGLLKAGINAYGIEGSIAAKPYLKVPEERIHFWDLREPIKLLLYRFDLAYCIETAEHIEPEYADIFVDNLVKLSDRVLLSAAPPGQKGKGHVNCQPHEYWIEKFEKRGYRNKPEVALRFWGYLQPLSRKRSIALFFNRNLMYFEI